MTTIYTFGLGEKTTETSKEVLGGKGAGLVHMTDLGINIPAGIIIPTTAWEEYKKAPKTFMKSLPKYLKPYLAMLNDKFGYMPLVSVRSGARVSCPGMMDTILNVGIDSTTKQFWETKLGTSCVTDSADRLQSMYKNVVGAELPDNAEEQLYGAIEAVFKSWNNERAKIYRDLNNIPDAWGTAVTIQSMVFGNFNDASCTGVLFTRNPSNGDNEVVGEFLVNAQGEDVVSGVRTPKSLDGLVEFNSAVADELLSTVAKLELDAKDMQDVEFTVQDGTLYILQTRNAKRTATASIKIALDLLDEGIVTKVEALKRIKYDQFLQTTKPMIDPAFKIAANGKGIPASTGVAVGKAVFSAKDAVSSKEPTILISRETTPDDIAGMHASVGILTAIGGATSHAAVVARGMDKVCVVGCTAMQEMSSITGKVWNLNGTIINEGDMVTLNGNTGEIWVGTKVSVIDGSHNPLLAKVYELAYEVTGAYEIITDVKAIKGTAQVFSCVNLSAKSIESDLNTVLSTLHGVLDLSSNYDYGSKEDKELFNLVGSIEGKKLALTKANILTSYIGSRETITLLIPNSMKSYATKLKNAGYKVIDTVTDIAGLLMATSLIQCDFSQLDSAIVDKILDLRDRASDPLDVMVLGSNARGMTNNIATMGYTAIQAVRSVC